MLNVTGDLKYRDFHVQALHSLAKTAFKTSGPSPSKLVRLRGDQAGQLGPDLTVKCEWPMSPACPSPCAPQRHSAPGSQHGGSGCFRPVKNLFSCRRFCLVAVEVRTMGSHHLKGCRFRKEGVGRGWLGAVAPRAMTLSPLW